MRSRWLERGFVVLSLATVGCYGNTDEGDGDGGGNGIATCGAFTACGGDLTGVWHSQSVCADEGFEQLIGDQGLPAECSGAMTINGLTVATTLTIDAQTYSETGGSSFEWGMQFNTTCVGALSGQTITAAQMPAFCSGFQDGALSDPGSPFTSMTCQEASGVCACIAVQEIPIESAGSYTLQGGTFVTDDGFVREFCVTGDELKVRSENAMYGGEISTYSRAP